MNVFDEIFFCNCDGVVMFNVLLGDDFVYMCLWIGIVDNDFGKDVVLDWVGYCVF